MSREWGCGEPDDVAQELRMHAFAANARRAIKGKRGQAFLRKLEVRLDGMDVRALSKGWRDGDRICLLATMLDQETVEWADGHERSTSWEVFEAVAAKLGISPTMACELAYTSDNPEGYPETDEERHVRMLWWVREQIAGVER